MASSELNAGKYQQGESLSEHLEIESSVAIMAKTEVAATSAIEVLSTEMTDSGPSAGENLLGISFRVTWGTNVKFR